MAAKRRESHAGLSILDAVEALSEIADLEFEKEVERTTLTETEKQNRLVTMKVRKWIDIETPDETVKLVKNTLNVIFRYLKRFYHRNWHYRRNKRAIEGVKNIMVLVGEAARKLDKFTTIFKKTGERDVRDLREYKRLQEFYLTRVAKKIDERVLSRWILALTKEKIDKKWTPKTLLQTRHIFIDLESVKKDSEYELFFLRKEAGGRFFDPHLIRNIKLLLDFGEKIGREKLSDPFEDVKFWQDQILHSSAKNIIRAQGMLIDNYLRVAKKQYKKPLVVNLNKAICALFLCANPRNMLKNAPPKSCGEYFHDFQSFLRRALESHDYRTFIAYPKIAKKGSMALILEFAHRLCKAIYTNITGYYALFPAFEKIVREAERNHSQEHVCEAKKRGMFWNALASLYGAMEKAIKAHPYGYMSKNLEIIDHGLHLIFDPLIQFNIPAKLYHVRAGNERYTAIRVPTPTSQEFIHKAQIVEEYKGFLRYLQSKKPKEKHLIINLQDRTSWKEHVRAISLEELQNSDDFDKNLTVVTLPKNTELYHQSPPYSAENHAEPFINNLKKHFIDETCGFFFPESLREKLYPHFIDSLLKAIHKVFFYSMNVLTKENRLDFIELFYFFLQLKIIEIERPDFFSMVCKDGLDVGGASCAQIFALLKIINNEKISSDELENIYFSIFLAPLIVRERIINRKRFDRMLNAIKRVETTKHEIGAAKFKKIVKKEFFPLYQTPILSAELDLPKA